MKFTKMHGCGNDYIYVYGPVPNPSRMARFVSDRHFGIGADGLILILPPSREALRRAQRGPDRTLRPDFKMRMFNADGSEGEMCGNGVRCIGKYVYDRGLTRKKNLAIETRAGLIPMSLVTRGGKVHKVRVDMGAPRPLSPRVYRRARRGAIMARERLAIGGKTFELHVVSMGNPHCVIPVANADRFPVEEFGRLIERHPLFPSRTNVEFVQILNRREIRQRTWERGSGETLACGTGASAVLTAMALTKRCDRGVTIHLNGGDLEMEYAPGGHIFMTGPAVEVCRGEWGL